MSLRGRISSPGSGDRDDEPLPVVESPQYRGINGCLRRYPSKLVPRLAATRGGGYFPETEGAHKRAIVRDCWASALPANGIHSRLRVKKSTASMSHRVGEMA